jgi:hypothetical protein
MNQDLIIGLGLVDNATLLNCKLPILLFKDGQSFELPMGITANASREEALKLAAKMINDLFDSVEKTQLVGS